MAQLNVAREPSMDEILASIRKIIESNETGPAAPSARQTFEDNDDIELAIDSEIEAAVSFQSAEEEIASVRRSPAVPAEERAGATTEPATPPSPLSLADVAARVRAASERHAASYAGQEPPMPEVPAPQDSPVLTSRMAAVASSAGTAPSVSAAAAAHAAVLPDAAAEPAETTSNSTESATQPMTADSIREAERKGAAIVSPAVGRQVARAFDDLAHAVELGPRRSFDEIAEAMLRPMLQEWLDDNLPTLVERLVREEIERVARGTRR
ncbi:hypothetical protein SJ05684_c13590 [Sinorhizobium sojae CCBAU 05684]|uniref:DUF2497 domain-containing protein n=1 Tax=Sinorhizobium sojae CCBAU 05684 TaxID=716928 RepID=A0A249PAW1_9HYPH|nr:PopZ family protein [Sinorhizobium sojae]ASY62814.1 hypothetical protein SJ05684_c13590 [Sinorhizobium sojae CCBAU 05684]